MMGNLNNMRVILVVFLLIFFNTHVLLAQGNDPANRLIDVEFKDATINQFVSDIETKTGVRIYYDISQFEGFRISIAATGKPLAFILEQVFKGSNYHFIFGDDNLVFLTERSQIITDLAEPFFNTGKRQKNGLAEVPDYFNQKNSKNTPKANTENKVYQVGLNTNSGNGKVTVAGYLKDTKSGAPVVGASIYAIDLKVGVTSDQFGFYSLTLTPGRHTLLIKAANIRDTKRQVLMNADGKLDIELQEEVFSLREVKISAEKTSNLRSLEMGINKIDIRSIKQVPTAFGEADVLRVVLTLPGVQSVGEASTGFNVRGGSADQNLILLDDATIYNPAHFFGFFSAFNPDLVRDVQLYKSSIPERFGGRLSSVLEVNNREGNKKKFAGSAGIGLLTSRLNIEGPIDSNRTSFILGGRTTYSNWLLKLLPDSYKNSKASFSDVNLGISHKINDKNNLYLAGYYSTDKFKLNSDTTYGYSNRNASIKWKHNFNNKFIGVFSAGVDDYKYNIESTVNPVNAYKLNFEIGQYNIKSDFNYYLNSNHTFNFGISSLYYKLHPGDFQPVGENSLILADVVPEEKALESAIYFGDKFDITDALSVNAGLRYSLFNYLGPQTIDNYAPGLPKTVFNVLDSTRYGNNEVIHTYHAPEFRLSARYNVSEDLSIKAAYNTLRQYIHLLSNTTSIAPTDVWKLSDPNIKPQNGSQVSLGLYKNFSSNTIETSVEVYYKTLKDYLDYKSGASLVLNNHIETDVVNTKGKAYGVEVFIKKNAGKLNGWMSYAYSRTFLRFNDPNVGEPINGGAYYPANYDKPHAVNFTGNYRFSHRFSLSLNATYSTGRPITLPIAKYYYQGGERVYYSDRNAYRIPDYFRTDLSVNIDGNHKVHQLTHNSWTIGVYNLTGRQNAFSTYFTQESGVINGYKLSIFATAIPFVNYNIRF
jgi:hypothetical protein